MSCGIFQNHTRQSLQFYSNLYSVPQWEAEKLQSGASKCQIMTNYSSPVQAVVVNDSLSICLFVPIFSTLMLYWGFCHVICVIGLFAIHNLWPADCRRWRKSCWWVVSLPGPGWVSPAEAEPCVEANLQPSSVSVHSSGSDHILCTRSCGTELPEQSRRRQHRLSSKNYFNHDLSEHKPGSTVFDELWRTETFNK